MPTIDLNLTDCVVIVVRNGESRPEVINAFSESALRWVATREPELFELIVRAMRLTGEIDETLDGLSLAAGGERGDDTAWLAAWQSVDSPEEARRLRLVREGDEAA